MFHSKKRSKTEMNQTKYTNMIMNETESPTRASTPEHIDREAAETPAVSEG